MSLFKSVSLTIVAMGVLTLSSFAGGWHFGSRLNIDIGLPLFVSGPYYAPYYASHPVYYAPAPAYYVPAPTYYAPPPVYYAQPSTYYAPEPVVVRQRWVPTPRVTRTPIETAAPIRFVPTHVVTNHGEAAIETVTPVRPASPQAVATHGSVWIETVP